MKIRSHPHSRNVLKEREKKPKKPSVKLRPTSLPVTMTTAHGPLAGTQRCLIGGVPCSVLCVFLPLTHPAPQSKEKDKRGRIAIESPKVICRSLLGSKKKNQTPRPKKTEKTGTGVTTGLPIDRTSIEPRLQVVLTGFVVPVGVKRGSESWLPEPSCVMSKVMAQLPLLDATGSGMTAPCSWLRPVAHLLLCNSRVICSLQFYRCSKSCNSISAHY